VTAGVVGAGAGFVGGMLVGEMLDDRGYYGGGGGETIIENNNTYIDNTNNYTDNNNYDMGGGGFQDYDQGGMF
jgi:hypothetical protein